LFRNGGTHSPDSISALLSSWNATREPCRPWWITTRYWSRVSPQTLDLKARLRGIVHRLYELITFWWLQSHRSAFWASLRASSIIIYLQNPALKTSL
jgi:hypothetical protein